jgi:homoserine O-acetyltransferase
MAAHSAGHDQIALATGVRHVRITRIDSPSREVAMRAVCLSLPLATLFAAHLSAQAPPVPSRVASLGECRLGSGAVIPDCRVAWRDFGTLNADRSNVVLIPTWLLGRSDDWVALLGTDGFVDTTHFHVIIVDALGDGLSSSPSNSDASAQRAFDDLTTGDMVESQHRLLTERLGVRHVRAVMGFSMGGMQAIEWAVRYPGFVDRIVSIAGSPRVGVYDRQLWRAMLAEIEDGRRGGLAEDSTWARLARWELLFIYPPRGLDARDADSVAAEIARNADGYRRSWKLDDYAAQLRAIGRHDATLPYGGDVRRAAGVIRARMLAVYSWDDHMVSAGPLPELARLVHADTLSIASACGHVMMFCEQRRVAPVVRAFIER